MASQWSDFFFPTVGLTNLKINASFSSIMHVPWLQNDTHYMQKCTQYKCASSPCLKTKTQIDCRMQSLLKSVEEDISWWCQAVCVAVCWRPETKVLLCLQYTYQVDDNTALSLQCLMDFLWVCLVIAWPMAPWPLSGSWQSRSETCRPPGPA